MPEAIPLPNYNQPGQVQGIPQAIPTYPVQNGTTQAAGSSGGLVNVAAQIQSGVQNGLNMANQSQQMARATQNYNEQQATNKGNVNIAQHQKDIDDEVAGIPKTSPTGNGGTDFFHALANSAPAQALMAGVHAIGNAITGNRQAIPTPAPQGPPAPAALQGPPAPQAPPVMPTQALSTGGPVMGGGFGVSDAGIRGIQGFADGGAIPPAPAPQAAPAVQQAPAPDQPPAALSPNDPHMQLANTVEGFHQLLLNNEIDHDTQTPTPEQAVAQGQTPQQQTAQAVQSASQVPDTQTGNPGTTPTQAGKPHSLSWQVWDQGDDMIDQAVIAAAAAGRDPGQVRSALEANRNAWVQGHVMRYLSAANAAILNGEDDKAEQALKNAYYYFPDGQELNVGRDPKTNKLTYQDPVKPFLTDDKGNPDPNKPNMIPVDAAHIQMVGTALLDPMQLQSTINTLRMNAANIYKENMMAQGAYMTGEGNLARGHGILAGGNAKLQGVAADNYNKFSEGEKARAIGNYFNQKAIEAATNPQGKLDPQVYTQAKLAGQEYDNIALGRLRPEPDTIPVTGKNGKTVMTPNQNAGKMTRDTTQVPAALKSLTPEQHVMNKQTAAEIAAANRGMTGARAADLAVRMQIQRGAKHQEPDGSTKPDVLLDANQNTGHVWDKNTHTWIHFYLHPKTANNIRTGAAADPADLTAALQASGQNGLQSPDEAPDPEATAPDMESPTAG